MISSLINSFPKIDLHCHIDGSFSNDFVRNALGLSMSDDELSGKLRAPSRCRNLAEYLERFDLPISCLQTKENITLGVYDILKNAAAENVKYIELRFAPSCSINDELGFSDIYEACIQGIKMGENDFGIYSSIIVCAMRHHTEVQNLAVLNSAMDYLGHGICALDLAGDEAAFPNKNFDYLFTKARNYGIPFTIHSGECHSVENVRYALEAGAKRIGHGIALIKDKSLMSRIKTAGLGLELCPTSNYQTGALAESDIYPLKGFLDYGLLATVNTDNRTVSNTTSTDELEYVINNCGITPDYLETIYRNSVEISFAEDNIKDYLLKLL